jgi:transposase InsO family protein
MFFLTSRAVCHYSQGLQKKYQVPFEIQTDNGPEFRNKLMDDLCDMLQMKWIKSSIYPPWSLGKVEIFNKTVKRLLAKEVQDGNRNWHEILPRITLFYNATCHTTTGTSPFKLKHATKVVLPWAVSMNHKPEARTQGKWTRELGDNISIITSRTHCQNY